MLIRNRISRKNTLSYQFDREEGRNEHVIKSFTHSIFNPTRNLPCFPSQKIEALARWGDLPEDTGQVGGVQAKWPKALALETDR